MKTTFIYILIDPQTNQVRYVGKSNKPNDRYRVHLTKNNKKSYKTNWIQSLLKKNLKPILETIDEVPIENWQFWETYWISQFKSWGFNLTNSTIGGDGCTFTNLTSFNSNHNPWNKGITGYSTSKKGKPLQKETKEKISNTLKSKPSKKKRKVKQLDMNRNLIKEFSSITEAKLKTGIKGINNVLTGRAKKAGGYLWE